MHRFAWFDRGLKQTNPVLVLQSILRHLEPHFALGHSGDGARFLAQAIKGMAEEGALLPPFAVDKLVREGHLPEDHASPVATGRTGVVGLVVEPEGKGGLVLPLRACGERSASEGWQVDETLPFRREELLDALAHLVEVSGLPTAGALPERLAFAISNPLRLRAAGNSMTVAAALAVLDALNGHRSDLLRCACSVVEMAPGGRLQAVEHIRPKLEAVVREHDRGSLLVCAPGCADATSFAARFDTVWEVSDWADLARKLAEADRLAPLLRRVPLRRIEGQRVLDQLRWLVREARRDDRASELGRRLSECAWAEPVAASLRAEIERLVAESWRHQGRFVEANAASRRIYEQVAERGDWGSHDELADAAAEYAAALFDGHCFRDIPPLLQPWAQEAERDPRLLRPETRVKVFNTLGRALVVLGEGGWEDLFRRTLELQERLDPGNVNRTKCSLIFGLLRSGQLGRAAEELAAITPLPAVEDFSGRYLRFLYAGLARRKGERWHVDDMETAAPSVHRPGHPSAFYFQATARQPGREDAPQRLQRAAELLRQDGRDHPQNICSLFAHGADLYAAALAGDPEDWARAVAAVEQFLEFPEAKPLRAHYGPALGALRGGPDDAAAEWLFSLVPYF